MGPSLLDDSNSQQDHGSSDDPGGNRTLFAIIPQQQLTGEGATLDQNTINNLLSLASEQEKLNPNPGLLYSSSFRQNTVKLSVTK